MLHFIPAWYQQDKWSENEQSWHVRRMHTEFDDTVKQIQLFHRSKVYPYKIMLLSFAPNFRHFIHRQSVYHAPYWSCFDSIQEIRRKKAMVFSFHNLNWPEHVEFIYTTYVVMAKLHNEKYAQIEFGEDGNPIRIDMFRNGSVYRRNIYDDRGFVSSTIIFDNDKEVYQEYLMENGVWKMRHFFQDGHVEINQECKKFLLLYDDHEYSKTFSKQIYESLDEVIKEVVTEYVKFISHEDIFCVAMHDRHATMLNSVLEGRKTILSYFEKRYDMLEHPEGIPMLDEANYVITDSQEQTLKLMQDTNVALSNVTNITPYDTRTDFGISQQLSVYKILVPVDELEDREFDALMQIFGKYILKNDNVEIHLFTRMAEHDIKRKLLRKVRHALKRVGLEEGWALEKPVVPQTENELDEMELIPIKFFVQQCVDELSVSKCMREQRLVVDMRRQPQLYLQISAISVGIPQVLRSHTQFIENGRNGRVINKISELPRVLDFYLKGLKNWNQAMIYTYEVGKKYTTDVLVDSWKEVINSVRRS